MINKKQIRDLVEKMHNIVIVEKNIPKLEKHKHLLNSHWLEDPLYNLNDLSEEERLLFLLILDGTSFSYWSEPRWQISHNCKRLDGAKAMIFALKRAVDKGNLKLSVDNLSNLSREEYREILKGTTEIPLFEERFQILKEIVNVLNEKFDGNIKNIIKFAKGDALKLLEILVKSFKFFEDYITYEDERIELNKKAQLFILDVYRIFGGEGLGKLANIEELTACADYKLPQVLRRMEIFEYSPELAERIDKNVPLPSGSLEETEIRIKTIFAVERIKKYFNETLKINTRSDQVNELLWKLGQIKHSKDKPYHKVRTTKY